MTTVSTRVSEKVLNAINLIIQDHAGTNRLKNSTFDAAFEQASKFVKKVEREIKREKKISAKCNELAKKARLYDRIHQKQSKAISKLAKIAAGNRASGADVIREVINLNDIESLTKVQKQLRHFFEKEES